MEGRPSGGGHRVSHSWTAAGLGCLSDFSCTPWGSLGPAHVTFLQLDLGPKPINLVVQAICTGASADPVINLAGNRTYFYTSSH